LDHLPPLCFRFDEFCDVTLEADSSSKAESEPNPSTSIRAHKFVLAAASPYFREKLSSDSYVESKEICVVVKDIDDKTLRLLVDYMYTGRLDINENNVRALYGAAEILLLDSVRSECSWYLKEHLSISNCLEIAAFAKAQNCTGLDDAAVSFAGQHFGNSWRVGPEMQRRRCALGVAALNGTIFAVGGLDISYVCRDAEMLDPRLGEWISLPSIKNSREDFALTAANGLLYAVAGKSGNQFLNSVLFNYQRFTRSARCDVQVPRYFAIKSLLSAASI
uniref:Kelch-like protein 7 (inferred by orthology to a human protein) n=1 Tax=Nippostrongylus brasiliensis TaxID=27835 RepID=A0A0N4YSP5_NIPBR